MDASYDHFYKTYRKMTTFLGSTYSILGPDAKSAIRTDLWRYLSQPEILQHVCQDENFMRGIYNKLEWLLVNNPTTEAEQKEHEVAAQLKRVLCTELLRKTLENPEDDWEVIRFPLLKAETSFAEPLVDYLNTLPADYREVIYYELRDLEPNESKVTIALPRYYDKGDFLDAVEMTFTFLAHSFDISFSSDETTSYCKVSWNRGSILIPDEINPHFTSAWH
jgi:hypothetical protein